jgi:replicative DNA helicase
LNILHHVCAVQRRPAAFYSLEMPAEQIVSNFLCVHNRVDTHDFRRGTLQQRDWDALEASLSDLAGLPMLIDDSPTLRILDLRARARRLMHRHELELLVVDYLQLLSPNRRFDSRAAEVAEISQGLKALARELKVPLIAVAQLSRRVEQEQRRPRLSDLRESGAIEQDADVVLLLHRPQELADEQDDFSGSEADLILAKQRNGPTGVVRLVFQKRYLRFESRATSNSRNDGLLPDCALSLRRHSCRPASPPSNRQDHRPQ